MFQFDNKKYYSVAVQSIMKTIETPNTDHILTPREIEIIEHFSTGLTVDERAKRLFLSRHTIAAHRRKIFVKTASKNITELLHFVRKGNLFNG